MISQANLDIAALGILLLILCAALYAITSIIELQWRLARFSRADIGIDHADLDEELITHRPLQVQPDLQSMAAVGLIAWWKQFG